MLRTLAQNAAALEGADWRFLVEAMARIQLEDWQGALAIAFREHFESPTLLLMTHGAFDFVRSLIYSHVGQNDAARECYARGMANWTQLTGGNPAAWERSDVMRWRRAAEAVLPR